MLQNIRQQVQGPTIKILVWLIVISFSPFLVSSRFLWEVEGGVNGRNGSRRGELQQAINTQKRRLISMMGENFDPAMVEDDVPAPRCSTPPDWPILMMQSAKSMDLAVSCKELDSPLRAWSSSR